MNRNVELLEEHISKKEINFIIQEKGKQRLEFDSERFLSTYFGDKKVRIKCGLFAWSVDDELMKELNKNFITKQRVKVHENDIELLSFLEKDVVKKYRNRSNEKNFNYVEGLEDLYKEFFNFEYIDSIKYSYRDLLSCIRNNRTKPLLDLIKLEEDSI